MSAAKSRDTELKFLRRQAKQYNLPEWNGAYVPAPPVRACGQWLRVASLGLCSVVLLSAPGLEAGLQCEHCAVLGLCRAQLRARAVCLTLQVRSMQLVWMQ